MNINRALIERFLKNQCTAEEAAAVGYYLQNHPEELADLLPEQDWEAFEPDNHLHPAYSSHMLHKVRREATTARKRRYSAWACAAVVLLLGGSIWWQYDPKPTLPQSRVAYNGKEAPHQDTLVQYTGNSSRLITLPDGSTAVLEKGSSLQWQAGFTATMRALYLKGAATFTVTKDEGRPFIVYSGNVATTVLGTAFRISAYEGDRTVKIRLLTGKIMVNTTGAQAVKEMVYLTPGQECAFNKGKRSLTVYDYERKTDNASPELVKGHITDNGDELLFTNVPLPEVMNRFSTEYHTRINYTPQQLRKSFFTGQVRKKDSLGVILGTIAELNRLQVSRDSTGFRIYR